MSGYARASAIKDLPIFACGDLHRKMMGSGSDAEGTAKEQQWKNLAATHTTTIDNHKKRQRRQGRRALRWEGRLPYTRWQ